MAEHAPDVVERWYAAAVAAEPGRAAELGEERRVLLDAITAPVTAVLVTRAAGEIAHHVSPAIGWYRMADAEGRSFDTSLLDQRYRDAAEAVLGLQR